MDILGYFCVYGLGCCVIGCYLAGNEMNFDFLNFFALVGLSGGVLSLIDFAWFAYSGSNIDYSLKILGMVIAVDFVCAFGGSLNERVLPLLHSCSGLLDRTRRKEASASKTVLWGHEHLLPPSG